MLEINFTEMKLKDAVARATSFGLATFEWHPCIRCGCTTRYASRNGSCVPCSDASTANSNAKTQKRRNEDVNFRIYNTVQVIKNSARVRNSLPRVPKDDKVFWGHWMDEMIKIEAVKYILTLATGEEWESDHICALESKSDWLSEMKGETVACGVHAPWNMWVLPKRVNRAKSHTFYEPICIPFSELEIPYYRPEDIQASTPAQRVAIMAKVEHMIRTYDRTGYLPQ